MNNNVTIASTFSIKNISIIYWNIFILNSAFYILHSITMTENLITYAIVVVVAILAIFAFTIGIEKMIKIILWNYILSSICLAASQSIVLAVEMMKKTPELTFMGFGYDKVANFLHDGSMTIILILYVILLVIIFRTSKIKISLPDDEALRKMLQIIFVPLTVISMVLTLQIAILGMNGINVSGIASIASAVANNPYMFQFVSLTPVRILLHGIITIIITSEFRVRVQTDL